MANRKPTHTVSVKRAGTTNEFDVIGSGWENENGNIALRIPGTQIISGSVYINKIKERTQEQTTEQYMEHPHQQ